MTFSAFVSCSVHPEDQQVVNWFLNWLKAHDIEPHVVGLKPEVGRLREQIRGWIESTDCTTAIMTRRDKIEGRDAWKAPDWVRDEAIIARELDKPLIIFVEEGVEVGGILAENMYVKFNRQSIGLETVDKIKHYMESLANKLREKKNQERIAKLLMIIGAGVSIALLAMALSRR